MHFGLLEQIPFTTITLLLFGLFLIFGGTRILKEKKFFSSYWDSLKRKWSKPVKIDGKRTEFLGYSYIILGAFYIALSILTFFAGY